MLNMIIILNVTGMSIGDFLDKTSFPFAGSSLNGTIHFCVSASSAILKYYLLFYTQSGELGIYK